MSQELLFKGGKSGKEGNKLQLGKRGSPKMATNIFDQGVNKPSLEVSDPQEQLAQDGEISDPHCLVQFASYLFNRKQRQVLEEQIPDSSKFMALSWDPKASRLGKRVNKHYRYFIDSPLEESGFIDENTFDEFDIMRGSLCMKKGFFGGIAEPENLRNVGKFKGWLEVMSEKQKKTFKKELMGQIPGRESVMSGNKSVVRKSVTGDNSVARRQVRRSDLDSEFLRQQNVQVRVYVLVANGMPSMDSDGLSDPYVKVRLGD